LKVLVVGAGKIGARVIKQLRKKPKIKIITVDPRENPQAIEEGIIERVDYSIDLIPGEIMNLLQEVNPDLVLVTTSKDDISNTGAQGLELLVESLNNELEASSNYPIISVSRSE
jgi:predicted dinucleotide-utilizing enzyme